MKKSLFSLVALSVLALTACPNNNQSKEHITYGTYIHEAAIDIHLDELENKLEGWEKKENFLLCIYPSPNAALCGCWAQFSKVIDQYVVKYNTVVYKMTVDEVPNAKKQKLIDKGFTISDKNQPYFYIVQNGEVTREYIYSENDIFKKCGALHTEVTRHISDPNIYHVDQNILDNELFNEKKETLVYYTWSFCPDCQNSSPKVIWPYAHTHDLNKKLYYIDIGELTGYNPNAEAGHQFDNFSKSNPEYVTFLADHYLSSTKNTEFGYDRGFVPTIQYWNNGQLKDMSVYFNDAVGKDGDDWKITRSYYTEERKSSLKYTDAVLQGRILTADEIEVSQDGTSASMTLETQEKLHKPILNAFLEMYLK